MERASRDPKEVYNELPTRILPWDLGTVIDVKSDGAPNARIAAQFRDERSSRRTHTCKWVNELNIPRVLGFVLGCTRDGNEDRERRADNKAVREEGCQ